MSGRRGFLGRLAAVATAGIAGAHVAAAKEFPSIVRHPQIRYVHAQLFTSADVNAIMERLERLEAVAGGPEHNRAEAKTWWVTGQ